ncbi:oxidoreductase [Pseudonocardia sp. CA-107938]|uniref:oxidoreductase n=1 Tax=Pseudonocardia sp. CA-107938 TaxID=3240021 RepID=UPI003D8B71FA
MSSTDIPDQTGRTAIVTGGGSGIGRAAAAALAARGARVVLAVRDLDRGRAVAREIGGKAEARALDLASVASVREFAAGIGEPVDLLVNNAGTMTAALQHTADGFELQLGVNHLGHFALTNLLLDRITGRVVSVASSALRKAYIDFDDLHWERRRYKPFGAYGQSKLANLLFVAELQRRLASAGSQVIATAAHPGWAATGFTITTGNPIADITAAVSTRLFAQRPSAGARPTLLAATGDVPGASFAGPRVFGVRGSAAIGPWPAKADDAAVAARLWTVSEELTGTRFEVADGAAGQ